MRKSLLTLSFCVVAAAVIWHAHKESSSSDGTIAPSWLSEVGSYIEFDISHVDEYRYSDPFEDRLFRTKRSLYDDVDGY
jgi:hypothetical protein